MSASIPREALSSNVLSPIGVLRSLRVFVVSEERELELRIGIRKVVKLDVPKHAPDVVSATEQSRNHDQRSRVAGETFRKVELGQRSGRQEPREHGLDDRDGHGRCRHNRSGDQGGGRQKMQIPPFECLWETPASAKSGRVVSSASGSK